MCEQDSHVRTPLERRRAGQALEEEAAERVHVCASVDALAPDLLGRHVVDRAHPLRLLHWRVGLRDAFGQPEVCEVDVVGTLMARLGGDQDVRGLHIAVDEASGVRCVERACDLRHEREGLRRSERSPLEEDLHVLALDEAHRDEDPPVRLTGLIDRDDVRVVE